MRKQKDLEGFKLYYQGEWREELFAKCVAVVGSRRMTEYGRRAIEKIVPQLVQDGWTIVSGFMYGVDQYAHRTCVECGGKTIAVLGWGIDERLEASDQRLAEEIISSGGLLVSQWEDQKPALWTFPARNRIVAAIARETIVIEAALKSGSLITADFTLKLGKKVWAVPGPITSRVSEGTNQLIAEGKASIWQSRRVEERESVSSPILKMIENEGLDASEIARKLCQSIESIGAQLSLLTLSGEIEERGGKFYRNGI